ncbi:hypothetical protein BDW59DRAFT_158838 [Aspergillus cavernicola]|uniref:HRQ family protein n=1 Tax=Aspergillus cavernicola TaxID=176166 RepID=A0ABR4IPH1_9EURO
MQSYLVPDSLPTTPLTVLSLGILLFFLLFGIYIRSVKHTSYNNADQDIKHGHRQPELQAQPESESESESYPPVTPLPNFTWSTTEPAKYRPFKPKYHLTMGISSLDSSDLIPMDKTYKERLVQRRGLLKEYGDIVRAVNFQPSGSSTQGQDLNKKLKEALCEWYAFVMGVYLPERYPGMFRLVPGSGPGSGSGSFKEKGKGKKDRGTMLESLVTGLRVLIDPEELMESGSCSGPDPDSSSPDSSSTSTSIPDPNPNLEPEHKNLLLLLDTLGTWIDEDFLILLPSPSPSSPSSEEDEPTQYTLQTYSTYFPAGFNPRLKLSHALSTIHAPVPGYKAKLEKSMDRFFAKLEVGRVVVRLNWSVMTPGTGLFAGFGGLHGHHHDGKVEKKEEDGEEKIPVDGFDGTDTNIRVERQTLHRLPRSKALLFGVHTYTYPLQDIKDEGLGEELAVAIDGLKEGSVPGIHAYKRGPVWGEAVKAFLRG